jgi:hypothetical protein
MPDGPIIIKLEQFIGKALLIKVVGQEPLCSCKLESVDEHGIWVTGPELLRFLGDASGRYQLAFVSYASIRYLAAAA